MNVKKNKIELKDFSKKKEIGAGTLLAPLPVVIASVGTQEETNLITIAWVGIVNTKPPMLSISVRKERKSYEILKKHPKFLIHLLTKDLFPLADLVGTKSGKYYNKIEEHQVKLQSIQEDYPLALTDSPFVLCCTVAQQIPLGTHDLFLATIDTCFSSEHLLSEQGAISFDSIPLLSYAHGKYYAEGQVVGFFGEMRASKKVLGKKKKIQENRQDKKISKKIKKFFKKD